MRNESFKAYVSSLRRDDNTIWNPIKYKKTHGISTSNTQNSTPPGPWAKNDKEKAKLFAEHLSEVFSPHNNDPNPEVEQDLATPIHQHERLKPFTLNQIKNEIAKLNHKKAPGIDHITVIMLKELPQEGLLNLMYILNAIIRLEYWPKSLSRHKS